MLELYVSCWIFASIFIIGYILYIASKQTEIEQNLTFELLGNLTVIYFMLFFTWHINLFLMLSNQDEFNENINKYVKGLTNVK